MSYLCLRKKFLDALNNLNSMFKSGKVHRLECSFSERWWKFGTREEERGGVKVISRVQT